MQLPHALLQCSVNSSCQQVCWLNHCHSQHNKLKCFIACLVVCPFLCTRAQCCLLFHGTSKLITIFMTRYIITGVIITFQPNKIWRRLATRPWHLHARLVWLRRTTPEVSCDLTERQTHTRTKMFKTLINFRGHTWWVRSMHRAIRSNVLIGDHELWATCQSQPCLFSLLC